MCKFKNILLLIIVFSISDLSAEVVNLNTDKWQITGSPKYNNGFLLIKTKHRASRMAKITNDALLITGNGYVYPKFNFKSFIIKNSIIKVENTTNPFFKNGNSKTLNVILDNSSSIIVDLSGISAKQQIVPFKEIKNYSSVIEVESEGKLHIDMESDAVLSDCYIKGVHSVIIDGPFKQFHNVSFVNTTLGMTNEGAGRIDRYGISIKSSRSGWLSLLGNSNSGNNSFYDWNPVQIDSSKIIHKNLNNKYFQGFLASYRFVDKDDEQPVRNVSVIYRDNRFAIGSEPTQRARFYTNLEGKLKGEIDTRTISNPPIKGSNKLRKTLYFVTKQSDSLINKHKEKVGNEDIWLYDYTVQDIKIELDIRSYFHQSISYDYSINAEVGKVAVNGKPTEFSNYYLVKDENITNKNFNAVNKDTIVRNTEQLYDISKAKWRQSNKKDYPLITARGGILYIPDGWDFYIDALASNAYNVDFILKRITIKTGKSKVLEKTAKFDRIISKTGEIYFKPNANINFPYSDKDRDSYVRIVNVDDKDKVTIIFNSDTLFKNYLGEFGYAYKSVAKGTDKKHQVILTMENKTEIMKFYDLSNKGIDNRFSIGFIASDDLFTPVDRGILNTLPDSITHHMENDPKLLSHLKALLMLINKKIQLVPKE